MSNLLASLRVLLPHRNHDRFLTAVLGPKCAYGCGVRVFRADRAEHDAREHAGDPLP